MNTARRSVSRRAALGWAALLGALFFLVYGAVNAWTATRTGVASLHLPWERHIPFLPWTVIPYMSSDLLFVAAFLLCRDSAALRRLAARIAFAILVSAACFLIMPLQYAFARPEAGGLPGALFSLLSWDLPYNQFPSLHISLAIVLWPVFAARLRGAARIAAAAWFVLIAISTLTVYQHHAIDLAGGALVGALALHFFPMQSAPRVPVTRAHRRMAWRYGLGTGVLVALAGLNGGVALILLYPALSGVLVAGAYAGGRSDFLVKRAGGFCPVTLLLFAPYLFGSWLGWRYHRRRDVAWCEIAPGLLLGRRLSEREARADRRTRRRGGSGPGAGADRAAGVHGARLSPFAGARFHRAEPRTARHRAGVHRDAARSGIRALRARLPA